MADEQQQMLPSLSSWAYKSVPEEHDGMPVPVENAYVNNESTYHSSYHPFPSVFTSNFYALNAISKEDSYFYDNREIENGRIICVTPDHKVVSDENYTQAPYSVHESAPSTVVHSYSEALWETENDHRPLEEALFENTYWQSGYAAAEEERKSSFDDSDRVKKLTGRQRIAANRRERRRMNTINEAFENLRMHLPILECERKLSKADTLRVATDYIKFMSHILQTTAPKPREYGGRGDMLRITRTEKRAFHDSPESNECYEVYTESVLLTWSRTRKRDNHITRNGRKRIRAPIWNPEFPARSRQNTLHLLRSDSYSLGQQFVADSCDEPPSKVICLDNVSLLDENYLLRNQQNDVILHSTVPYSQDEEIVGLPHVYYDHLRSPCSTEYQNPLQPEVSPILYHSPRRSQSAYVYPRDIHLQKSPQSYEIVDPSYKNLSSQFGNDSRLFQGQELVQQSAFNQEELSHFVCTSPSNFHPTIHIHGRDITAL